MKREDLLPLVGGALGGTVFDLIIDFPLSDAGLLGAWQIRDAEGRYIWGIGTGDILGLGIGGGLTLGGHFLAEKGKPVGEKLRNAGIGWLLALTCIKIAELYGYLTTIRPVTYAFGELPIPQMQREKVPLIKEI